MTPIYLDHNATTPVDRRVLAELEPYLSTHFGNPSSGHAYGRTTRHAVELARRRTADLIGAQPDEVTFTGSGSESNVLAIRGAALAHPFARHGTGRTTIVTQVTEHPSVLNTCDALHRLHGLRVVLLPVDRHGRVDLDAARAAIDKSTLLVSIQLANGETGTIQLVADIARMAHDHGALFHTDAAQAAGKIATGVGNLDVDLLTIAGHKMYAPKGVAALYHRRGVALEPLVHGGGQEGGRRSGTENVAYVVALGAACVLARLGLAAEVDRIRGLRDLLHERLRDRLGRRLGRAVRLNGDPERRLPNTLNVSVDGIDARAVLAATPALAASTGSACHAGSAEPSGVLVAMGLPPDRAGAAVRLSLGRWTTEADVDGAVDALAATVEDGRSLPEIAGVQR
jgi:cysteine desulfurase